MYRADLHIYVVLHGGGIEADPNRRSLRHLLILFLQSLLVGHDQSLTPRDCPFITASFARAAGIRVLDRAHACGRSIEATIRFNMGVQVETINPGDGKLCSDLASFIIDLLQCVHK